MKPSSLFFSTVAALGFMLSAGNLHAAPTPTPTPMPSPSPSPSPVVLNDNQVLGLIDTANDAEISMGKVASTKAQKAEVKAFAAKMVTDHTAANAKIDALETKTGLKRQDSDVSKELKKNTDAMEDNLKNAKDADFDRTYIDGQVMMHQELLKALDERLIPGAQNPDLKTFLTDIRASVEAHLKEAQDIQKSLNPTP